MGCCRFVRADPRGAGHLCRAVERVAIVDCRGRRIGDRTGDCQTCEEDYPYRHGPGILFDGGYRVNPRMNVGGELFWVPLETASGTLNTTHIDAVAQFRPWSTHGFFLKGGAGMAFIRNWVDTLGPGAINSKALSVVVGGGWIFFPEKRVALELFASQHAGALGDLKTADADVPDVMGNYWSFGASIVFR